MMSMDQCTSILTERRPHPAERPSYFSHSLDLPPSSTTSWSNPQRSSFDSAGDSYVQNSSAWSSNVYQDPSPLVPTPLYPQYFHRSPSTDYCDQIPVVAASRAQTHSTSPRSSMSPPSSLTRSSYRHVSGGAGPKYNGAAQLGPDLYAMNSSGMLAPNLLSSTSSTSTDSTSSSHLASSGSPPVKVEPEDLAGTDCFVMEFSGSSAASQRAMSSAGPAVVPLRATQASKPMRKMMGVFRLNPFTIHESAPGNMTWTGEEAGPLEEEPRLIEFQLDWGERESVSPEPENNAIQLPQPHSHSHSSFTTRNVHNEGRYAGSGRSEDPVVASPAQLHYPLALSPASWEEPHYAAASSHRAYNRSPRSESSSSSSRHASFDASFPEYHSGGDYHHESHSSNSCGAAAAGAPYSLTSMSRRWPAPATLTTPYIM